MNARIIGTVVVLALGLALSTVRSTAQRGIVPADVSKPVPRAADGKPDLSGVWIGGGIGLLFGDAQVEALQKADAAAGRKPLPAAGPPPYKPEAEAKRQQYIARKGIDDPMARCLLSGVPRISVRPLPFEIIQLKDRVVILYEVHHGFRIIPTDGRPHPDDMEPSYLGDSIGRWEGDTLVVDVVGFNTNTWLAGVGTIHSEQLRVTERYTRDTYGTVIYDVTMEDPEVFTRPWKQYATFRLLAGERIREYECIESNEDIVRWQKMLDADSQIQKPR